MILLTLPDVLAVAARVVACDSQAIVDRTDLDAVEQTLIEAKEVSEGRMEDLADTAAALLTGLVRRRPFHHPPFTTPERQIALVVTLQFLALNDRDLDLEPIKEIDNLLDRIAAGAPQRETAVALRIRLRRLVAEWRTSRIPSEPWSATGDPWSSPEEKEPAVFERFTDRARRVVVLAQEEARLLSHDFIGTEHVLLGLIHEGEGVAAKALESLGISLEAVRAVVEEIIGKGQRAPSGHIPFTPRAKKVLELSMREGLQLGVNYIGTEHILLGLIREGEGVAAQVLVRLGADLGRVRQQVIQLVSDASLDAPMAGTPGGGPLSGRQALILQEINAEFEDAARLRVDNDRLAIEVARLRDLLRRRDIDPDSGQDRGEDGGQDGGAAQRPAS